MPYVSYAYAKGYTTGRDPVKGIFDPDTAMQARDYCTFLLRALDYDDKAGDFSWAKAMDKAQEVGLCTTNDRAKLESGGMTRADMVDLSYAALTKSLKGSATIVSVGPRVVTNGEDDYTHDYQFGDSRFTTMVCSRTAVGRDAEGRLLLISINGCTIAKMREAMLQIGCVDCFNTDGGASSAMYYRGNYVIQVGRTLAQTFMFSWVTKRE